MATESKFIRYQIIISKDTYYTEDRYVDFFDNYTSLKMTTEKADLDMPKEQAISLCDIFGGDFVYENTYNGGVLEKSILLYDRKDKGAFLKKALELLKCADYEPARMVIGRYINERVTRLNFNSTNDMLNERSYTFADMCCGWYRTNVGDIKIGDCEITIIGVLNEITTRLNNN